MRIVFLIIEMRASEERERERERTREWMNGARADWCFKWKLIDCSGRRVKEYFQLV